jgi:hypothetical protein
MAQAAASAIVSVIHAGAALAFVYLCGYVTGALLLTPDERDGPSMAMVRLISGLLLTTIGFLLSLVAGAPWFVGPAALLTAAVARHRRAAFHVPRFHPSVTWDGAAAAMFAAIVAAPVIVASLRMGAGDFPPVFFNVDSSYFLEKVHALTRTNIYPPESLGVAGGRAAYHFGTQAIAALISRASGIAPHQALFLIALPLLTFGIVAAAFVLARYLAPSLPSSVTIPMLLTAAPTLWMPFWKALGPLLWQAMFAGSSDAFSTVSSSYELWGIATNNGQNLATTFLTLMALAGMAMAPARGWRLPVFLIGSAMIFKAPTGVALASGFTVAQTYRALTERTFRPLVAVAAVFAVFGCVYFAFWIAPSLPVEYKTELAPFFHLKFLAERERVAAFVADLAWLFAPALILLPFRPSAGDSRRLPILMFAITPLVVVNTLQGVDLRPGFGIDQNWPQVLIPVPLLIHAFVLSVADARWAHLNTVARAAFLLLVTLAVAPPVWVAGRYTHVLLVHPEAGHEYVNNQPIGAALRTIPVRDSVIVTNDLRYPAEGFSRDLRQMQIPALFGHHAFAVNYTYESYSFSRGRAELQKLLQGERWTREIDDAARAHGWTHLLIRKDAIHPEPIPLERLFENELYAVYRFR